MMKSGFRLIATQTVAELASKAHTYEHEQSGARLVYLENDDDNKVFSITFKTPPADHTGVPHILEHSVLCGSRKFPLKEPFVELIKGSLNTFLNAMTFPDKTMYPVASQNDKDFRNLMDVYLDAVFFPVIHEQPEVLMQEGWHYELEAPEGELAYKGVVYNEMKGVFSSPESLVERKTLEVLFPDTTYHFESGGDPDFIPQLTQEQFLDFHRRYYHPANSYIYLYGKMNIEEQLAFLDEAYLSRFQRQEGFVAEIERQSPFAAPLEVVVPYPVDASESQEGKAFFGLSQVVGEACDAELGLAFAILNHLLLGTPGAPLKQALIAAGIGQDVLGRYEDALVQPVFSILVRGAAADAGDKLRQVVRQTLQELVTKGIDKELLEASINRKEFELREANFGSHPKGLIYHIRMLDSWLYGGDPLLHLTYEPLLAKMKEGLGGRYFEELIERHLLQNPHQVLVAAVPEAGLEERRTEELRQKLAQLKGTLAPAEVQLICEQTKQLKARQTKPDSPEALASIPLLALKDIEKKVTRIPQQQRQVEGRTVLLQPIFTNRIAYVNLYFDTTAVDQADLPYLFLLSSVLGKVDTCDGSYQQLAKEINLHTGGISYQTMALPKAYDAEAYKPRLLVKSKALLQKAPQLFRLLRSVCQGSRYDNLARLKELVAESKARMGLVMLEYGHTVALSRVLSYVSPVESYNESGVFTYYRFLEDLERNWADQAEQTSAALQRVAQRVFCLDRLQWGVTCEEEQYAELEPLLQQFAATLPAGGLPSVSYRFELQAANEGLMTAGKVQYVAKAYNFAKLNYAYTGSMKVLETVLRFDYLWNRVRVQGGAYGAFARFDRNGNLAFASYRDPNLQETLQVYGEMEDYLRSFAVSEREMTKYIIGTMSQLDAPLTPSMKGEKAELMWLIELTWEQVQQERDAVLSTNAAKLKELAEVVGACMARNHICVVGNAGKLQEQAGLFGKLVSVFS